MRAIQNEPILYRAYYTLAITTGLRRGELCALQWRDITGACELTVRRSRSCASGQIVESDTKSHRERIVTIPLGIWELLMALRQQKVLHSGVPDREQPILQTPMVMYRTRIPLPDICVSCISNADYLRITTPAYPAAFLRNLSAAGRHQQTGGGIPAGSCGYGILGTYLLPPAGRGETAGCKPDARFAEQPKSVLCCIYENKNRKAKKAG